MPEQTPPPAGSAGTTGTPGPKTKETEKHADSKRAGDMGLGKEKSEEIFGPVPGKVAEQKKQHADPGNPDGPKLTSDELSTRYASAPGTSRPVTTAKTREELEELVSRINDLFDDTDELARDAIMRISEVVLKANKTVARASQLRRRPEPDVEYPTSRLDPKLHDVEAQTSVQQAIQKEGV